MVSFLGCHVLYSYYVHKMEHWIKSWDDGNDVDIVYLARYLTVFHTNAYCLSWKLMVFLVMFWIGLWTFYQIDDREWFMFWLVQCYKWCSIRECAWSSPLYCLYEWLIPEVVQSNVAIFANDTKLYILINTPDNSPTIWSWSAGGVV